MKSAQVDGRRGKYVDKVTVMLVVGNRILCSRRRVARKSKKRSIWAESALWKHGSLFELLQSVQYRCTSFGFPRVRPAFSVSTHNKSYGNTITPPRRNKLKEFDFENTRSLQSRHTGRFHAMTILTFELVSVRNVIELFSRFIKCICSETYCAPMYMLSCEDVDGTNKIYIYFH